MRQKAPSFFTYYLAAGDTVAADKIDVDRPLTTSDLSVSDLQASIVIDLPKKWNTRFQQSVQFKRVDKSTPTVSDTTSDAGTQETAGQSAGQQSDDSTGGTNSGTGGTHASNIFQDE